MDCNSINIPIKASSIIKVNKVDDYDKTNLKTYQLLIGKLIYLSYNTKKQSADPRIRYLRVAKQVIQYIKSIMTLGITYGAATVITTMTLKIKSL